MDILDAQYTCYPYYQNKTGEIPIQKLMNTKSEPLEKDDYSYPNQVSKIISDDNQK